MRIIAGNFKGRKLNPPKGDFVRPTSDRVKEAVFSMLEGHIAGGVVVDLFSGTGNLGLEALSRGAKRCYFGDCLQKSIALTKSNIDVCGAKEQSIVIAGGFEKLLFCVPEKVDIFFLDPPYRKGLAASCLKMIHELEMLNEGGIIVCEHDTGLALPDNLSGFKKIKEKKYGRVLISLFG